MDSRQHNGVMMRVRGARDHNLQNIDVDLPLGSIVAITGVSGSGKSSLAFTTIYAEAERRYFESVAPYARRLLQQIGAPTVQRIESLPPAVALQQRRNSLSERSTVGTITGLSNIIRMLYSRVGEMPHDAVSRLDSDAFSANTAIGACQTCHGLGQIHDVTEESLVPDPTLSIAERAVAAWPGAWQGKNQRDILAVLGYDISRPWHELSQAERNWILFTDEQPVVMVDPVREPGRTQRPYKGMYMSARRYILRTLSESKSETQRQRALQYVVTRNCDACGGSRIRQDALAVTFAGLNIVELSSLPLRELDRLVEGLLSAVPETVGSAAEQAERQLLRAIQTKVSQIVKLGLGYLSLSRSVRSLATGEHQRLRIASQLQSGLFGVLYVLDEPSTGLHPSEVEPMIALLEQLRDCGNSVIAVEHNFVVARRADWIIDLGPGAGEHGGQVLYCGPTEGLAPVQIDRSRGQCRQPLSQLPIVSASANNIHELTVDIPMGVLVAVTGVSGSGKSTLITQLVPQAVHDGSSEVSRVIIVDQSPIGRTPRSNVATYTGLLDVIRKEFAAQPLSLERGYDAGRFSFNVEGGRCSECQGEGVLSIEMLFLPGASGVCPACAGSRYNQETLEVLWNGRNIADVLDLTVEEALSFASGHDGVIRILQTLVEVGLGYLRLGQPATELSGGEAQRIKLASELQRKARKKTLYILDEPSSGLHPNDVGVLMKLLHALVDSGSSVIVAEHNMNVVCQSDWVVDLGPGGGDQGGIIVAQGPPEVVAGDGDSVTAPFIRAALVEIQ